MTNEDDRYSARQREAHAQEAADWYARWQAGTVDEEAFARWRDSDPGRALALARLITAWEALPEPGVEASEPVVTRRRLMRGGMAGALLVAAGTGVFATRAYAWESATTRIGETRRLRLPDESVVVLNTDTELSWRFSSARRELWLERGEIAIDLRPGPAAHLDSDMNKAALAAGRFNARLRRTGLELVVLRGSASPPEGSAGAAPVKAQAYQRLSFADARPAITPVSGDAVEAALAWQSGEIVFLDTPLADAAAEYNRYLVRKIVIDGDSVGTIRVGGRFLASDPSEFLGAVSASLGVRVRTSPTAYHLSR